MKLFHPKQHSNLLLMVMIFIFLYCDNSYSFSVVKVIDLDDMFYYATKDDDSDYIAVKRAGKMIREKMFKEAEVILNYFSEHVENKSKSAMLDSMFLTGDLYFYWEYDGKFTYRRKALRWYADAVVEDIKSRNALRALYNMSNIYRMDDLFQEEEATIRRLVAISQQNTYYVQASFRLAEILSQKGYFRKAKKIYLSLLRDSLKRNNTDGRIFKMARYSMADLYRLEMGCDIGYKQFMKVYRDIPEFLDDTPSIIHKVVPCFLKKKKYNIIENIIKSYMKKHADDEDASSYYYRILGEINKQQARYDEATDYFVKSALYHKSSVNTFASEIGIIDILILKKLEGKRKESGEQVSEEEREILLKAILAYFDIIQKSSYEENKVEGYYKIGKVSERLNDNKNYLYMMDYIFETFPDSQWGKKAIPFRLKAFDKYIGDLYELKEYEKLIDIYFIFSDKEKGFINWDKRTYKKIASAMKMIGLYPMAIGVYSKIINEMGKSDDIRFLLGETLFINNNYEKAIEVLQEEIKNSSYASSLKIIADSFFIKGDFVSYVKYYKKWILTKSETFKPVSSDIFKFAFALQMIKDFSASRKIYKDLLSDLTEEIRDEKKNSSKVEELKNAYYNYLSVVYTLKDCRQYIGSIGEYKKLQPDNSFLPELQLKESNCFLNQGDTLKAKTLLEKVSVENSIYGKIARTKINTLNLGTE